MIRRLLGRRARENWGKDSKKAIRLQERREVQKEFEDEQLYPELEEEWIGPQWVKDIIIRNNNG